MGVGATVAIAVLVPGRAGAVDRPQSPESAGSATGRAAGPRARFRAFRSVQVWLTLAATSLGYSGMFGAFSYLAYAFTRVTRTCRA